MMVSRFIVADNLPKNLKYARLKCMDEVPDRLNSNRSLRWSKLCLAVVALVTLAAFTTVIWWFTRPVSPLPKSVVNSVSFQIYYPKALPQGYGLKKGSVSATDGIVFFALTNGNRVVSISEQTAPNQPPDVKNVQGNLNVQSLDLDIGSAVLGLSKGAPAGFILTKTTLISLNSVDPGSLADISNIIKNMQPIAKTD